MCVQGNPSIKVQPSFVLPPARLHVLRRLPFFAVTEILDEVHGDDREPVVGVVHVDVVEPQIALGAECLDDDVLAVPRQARELILVVAPDESGGGGVNQHRRFRQRLGALRGGEHERVGAVDGDVHVEHAERFADHAGVEVVGHRDRIAHGGERVARRVGAAVDRDATERLARHVVLVHVAARPRGVRRGQRDVLGPPAARPAGASAAAHEGASERIVRRAPRHAR